MRPKSLAFSLIFCCALQYLFAWRVWPADSTTLEKAITEEAHSDIQQTGDYSVAERYYQAALREAERRPHGDAPMVEGILQCLAQLHTKEHRYVEAETELKRIIELQRARGWDPSASIGSLAHFYAARGQCEQAIPLYEQSMTHDPRRPLPEWDRELIIRCFNCLGRSDKAREFADEITRHHFLVSVARILTVPLSLGFEWAWFLLYIALNQATLLLLMRFWLKQANRVTVTALVSAFTGFAVSVLILRSLHLHPYFYDLSGVALWIPAPYDVALRGALWQSALCALQVPIVQVICAVVFSGQLRTLPAIAAIVIANAAAWYGAYEILTFGWPLIMHSMSLTTNH